MTTEQELNAWRELGEEMGRAISFMSKDQFEDLFPDWVGPRLFDLQVRAKAHTDIESQKVSRVD